MKSKIGLALCAAITLLLNGCASRLPQFVPAPCPALPKPPEVLMRALPTMDLLPPEALGSGQNRTTPLRNDAQ